MSRHLKPSLAFLVGGSTTWSHTGFCEAYISLGRICVVSPEVLAARFYSAHGVKRAPPVFLVGMAFSGWVLGIPFLGTMSAIHLDRFPQAVQTPTDSHGGKESPPHTCFFLFAFPLVLPAGDRCALLWTVSEGPSPVCSGPRAGLPCRICSQTERVHATLL